MGQADVAAKCDGKQVTPFNGTPSTTTYSYFLSGRLATASSTEGWNQSYEYDGFSNLSHKIGTQPFDWTGVLNSAKNEAPVSQFDAVGNTVWHSAVRYDYENRLRSAPGGGPGLTETYEYPSDNKRVVKANNGVTEITADFAEDERTGVPRRGYLTFAGREFSVRRTREYDFDGNIVTGVSVGSLLPSNRLGSPMDHLPYRELLQNGGYNGKVFTNYFRDGSTGLDYADQRYYQPGMGRFLTADPYMASVGVASPASW
ncbi:MAG: hypothetical protein H7039_02040, partial [Bryobacteraceae bacterium]|nr:hypothetical protein [Bryobacteraceae bacterium]